MVISMTLSTYLQQIDSFWHSRNGKMLADFLSLRHIHTHNSYMYISSPHDIVNSYVNLHLTDIVSAHIKCVFWLSQKDVVRAHSEHNTAVQNFIKIFQQFKEDNWLLPVMNTMCCDLRLLAGKVDDLPANAGESDGQIKSREAMEKAAEVMMVLFRICSSDNRSSECDTKKWGMLSLVNQLFKLYFRMNKLHLMRPLIRAIDSSPLKDKFMLSQQITYRYYIGRKAMYDSEYSSANENLTFAFERCHKDSKRNKHLILIYLVPLRILLGYMPKKQVLEKYDLLQLWEVSEAVRCGSAKKLTESIERHQEFFIKCGIYLILERLRLVIYRNLFKKVYVIVNNPVLSMYDLLTALRFTESEDIELEEAHCILANLIHQGKVKGYISQLHQKVVLSKTDPFPKLSTAA